MNADDRARDEALALLALKNIVAAEQLGIVVPVEIHQRAVDRFIRLPLASFVGDLDYDRSDQ